MLEPLPDPEESAGSPEPRGSILLVDDHPKSLTALSAVLEPLGERLILAESGEQALRVLLRHECSVILLDVRMAGLDGLQTARIIRARPATRHIPIIFLTAQASDVEEIALAYESGAVDYVIKPFEPEILRAKVAVFVELYRERGERVRESRARAEAEAVARTVRTLQILSDAAMSHLEIDGLARELVDRSTVLFKADASALVLRDDDLTELTVQAGTGRPLVTNGRVWLDEGLLGVLASDRCAALLSADELSAAERSGTALGNGVESMLVVPLVAAGELLGLLLLGAVEPGRFSGGDLELLTLAADRMALAIDHVRRFADGRRLVETLQRTLLPERLPLHPRIQMAARYMPSGLAPQIGGDWYDAVALDGDRTAVMIGDVVGHGIRAATTMGELRNALRAFAIEGHTPGEALHQLDRVVHATFGPGMVATILFVEIDAAAGTVTLARAGHPPPALRGAGGSVRFLETERTLPIGVDPENRPAEAVYPIEPGETLLMFTDGLVERRGESLTESFDRLLDALATAPLDVDGICDHVLEQTAVHPGRDDDVAVVAVRLLAQEVGPLELTLPAIGSSVRFARAELRDWLMENAPDLDATARADLEVAWSEACSNVVRHAYGPADATFEASVAREPDQVRMTVRDFGHWREPSGQYGGRGLFLMRELCDEVVIERQPHSTVVTMTRLLPNQSPTAETLIS
jgi:serine phosphatase RsbU (regulator of sigma subunit)/CheY-like chemotaxis protein/anti-sigma regulatory factor (Ser/Thr protein kinase)